MIVIYTRYDRDKSLRMLNLYYHELRGKKDEYKGKIRDD